MGERGVAIVTGGGRGIGAAVAVELWRAGFKVAVASREDQPSAESTAILEKGEGRYYQLDISEIAENEAFLDRVENDLGEITCLVNNAGVTSLVRGDMLTLTPESFDRCVSVNLRGCFFLSQAVGRRFANSNATNPYRSIIFVSSANASIVGEARADYCITKSALPMMTQLFAARLAEHGVGVFEIRPGIIRTEMTEPVAKQYDPYIASGGVPMQRWGLPSDVASVAVTIAKGELPFTTGNHIDVGGGLQLHRLRV